MYEKPELSITKNSLFDIINWLKNGNIVCIHTDSKYLYYFSKDINNGMLIYIDVSIMPSLMDDYEWPWYIENEGFFRYKDILTLPTDENKIYKLSL